MGHRIIFGRTSEVTTTIHRPDTTVQHLGRLRTPMLMSFESTLLDPIIEDQETTTFTPRANSLYTLANHPQPTNYQPPSDVNDTPFYENLEDYEADDPDLSFGNYDEYEEEYQVSDSEDSDIYLAQACTESPARSENSGNSINPPSPQRLHSSSPHNEQPDSPKARSSKAGTSSGSPRMARGGKTMSLSPRERNEAVVRNR